MGSPGILEVDCFIDPVEGDLSHFVHPPHEVKTGCLEHADASPACGSKRASQVTDGVAPHRDPPGAFRKRPMGYDQVRKAQLRQPALDGEDGHDPPVSSAPNGLRVPDLHPRTSRWLPPSVE